VAKKKKFYIYDTWKMILSSLIVSSLSLMIEIENLCFVYHKVLANLVFFSFTRHLLDRRVSLNYCHVSIQLSLSFSLSLVFFSCFEKTVSQDTFESCRLSSYSNLKKKKKRVLKWMLRQLAERLWSEKTIAKTVSDVFFNHYILTLLCPTSLST
jgi:hypothetical protein